MLRLLSYKAKGCKDFWKPSTPCHVGIHWIALAEYSLMSTHLPGIQLFFKGFLHFLVFTKLANSSIRVKKGGGGVSLAWGVLCNRSVAQGEAEMLAWIRWGPWRLSIQHTPASTDIGTFYTCLAELEFQLISTTRSQWTVVLRAKNWKNFMTSQIRIPTKIEK